MNATTHIEVPLLLEGLNPPQRQAVEAEISQNVQVLAGAGTGKTRMLSHRAVYLAQKLLAESPDENPFEKLFIATFSDKAASHLYESIETLWLEQTGSPLPEKTWIGTLHSLAFKILKQCGGKTSSQHREAKSILNKLDQLTIQETYIELLLGSSPETIVETLIIPREKAILLSPEYWLDNSIADIESLYTDIVTHLIPQIKAAGLSPTQFSKLAKEQTQLFYSSITKLPTLYHPLSGEPFSDIHAFSSCWEQQLKPYSSSQWQLTPGQWDIELEHINAQNRKDKRPKTELNMLLAHICKIAHKEKYVSYNAKTKQFSLPEPPYTFEEEKQLLALELALIDLAEILYTGYQQLLLLEQACDFDDILLDILAFKNTSQDNTLFTHLQNQFRHYLIDEFQDTNGAQLSFIQLLSKETAPITVVGDIKQSIYGFRYAQPENLNTIFSTRENILKISLVDNYRSHPDIIQHANQVSHFLGLDSKLHTLSAKKIENNKPESIQGVTWKSIETPQIHSALQEQNTFISETISKFTQSNKYHYQDIAILVPNHQQARALQEVLNLANIPAIRQKSLGFFEDRLILAISQWLQWLAEPENNMALIGWLQYSCTPMELIEFVTACAQQNKALDYTSASRDLIINSENKTLSKVLTLIATSQAVLPHQTMSLPHQALEKLAPPDLQNQLFSGGSFQEITLELQSLQTVLKHWAEISHNKKMSVEEKPAYIIRCLKRALSQNELELPILSEEKITVDAPEPDVPQDKQNSLNAVHILTTHAAKGLEFPVVFLAGVESYKKTRVSGSSLLFEPQHAGKNGLGLLLSRYRGDSTLKSQFYKTIWHAPQRLKESLNLLYVSLTRAKECLIITHCPKSFDYLNPKLYPSNLHQNNLD